MCTLNGKGAISLRHMIAELESDSYSNRRTLDHGLIFANHSATSLVLVYGSYLGEQLLCGLELRNALCYIFKRFQPLRYGPRPGKQLGACSKHLTRSFNPSEARKNIKFCKVSLVFVGNILPTLIMSSEIQTCFPRKRTNNSSLSFLHSFSLSHALKEYI